MTPFTLLPNVARGLHLRALRVGGRMRTRAADSSRAAADPSRLRVLVVARRYFPEDRDFGGAEVTLHAVLRRLVQRGHEIRVLLVEGPKRSYEVDEVHVDVSPGATTTRDLYRWADIVLGTHERRGHVLRDAARWGRPVVYYMQLGRQPRHLLYGTPQLTIFNSCFLRDEYTWMRGRVVLHPPIDEADYLTRRGEAITLVNPNEEKGGRLVFTLAALMPERRFLTVRSWGVPVVPDRPAPNVTVLPLQADMRGVYARTRILLLPSSYESYGRVGLEAAVSGIPTIAHDLPALRESLADAAIWIDPGSAPEAWIARIEELDNPAIYAQWSARARARFDQLDPQSELDHVERALVSLAMRGRRRTRQRLS
jgi:glycosyltransferase involved in cell wall biosynthesis